MASISQTMATLMHSQENAPKVRNLLGLTSWDEGWYLLHLDDNISNFVGTDTATFANKGVTGHGCETKIWLLASPVLVNGVSMMPLTISFIDTHGTGSPVMDSYFFGDYINSRVLLGVSDWRINGQAAFGRGASFYQDVVSTLFCFMHWSKLTLLLRYLAIVSCGHSLKKLKQRCYPSLHIFNSVWWSNELYRYIGIFNLSIIFLSYII